MNTQLVHNWLNHLGGYRASRVINERRLTYRMSFIQEAKRPGTRREQERIRYAISRAKEQEMIFQEACARLPVSYREVLNKRYLQDTRGIELDVISDTVDALTRVLHAMEQAGTIQYRIVEGYVIMHRVHQRTA
ncbi:hypothetical protein [Paenibacillus popilliae]|uniref:DNA-directed RNA polymerase n=1 Tax=Paenibacillus popilliae ATCC 14706 TaxID=1212764 RepID=M9L7C9_PAEPP|nr:hypothetical protein [Paenibacillus popilliae]GAC40827.1 DNA-directed RNA polymerase [Paenibacillus popilliae ATCC 14706]